MFFVYLLPSQPHGTLYVGVTSNLLKRIWEHKIKADPGFTAKYGVDRLVWFETHAFWEPAIPREKQMKRWKRAWKISLIEADNSQGIDCTTGYRFDPKRKSSRKGGSRLSPADKSARISGRLPSPYLFVMAGLEPAMLRPAGHPRNGRQGPAVRGRG